jgi:molybdenum cofactor guanylyltransferase
MGEGERRQGIMGPDVTVAGVILAGGKASRMGGGDKGLQVLHGRSLLDHVIDRVRPQVRALALNANGDAARFAAFALPVLPDPVAGQPGPLAGILAGMRWAETLDPAAEWLLSVPTDTPFLPRDLVVRLKEARGRSGAAVACAAAGGQLHPVVALWPVALAQKLCTALAEGVRGVGKFAGAMGLTEVDFTGAGTDPFLNINDMAELAAARGSDD